MENDEVIPASTSPALSKPLTNGLNPLIEAPTPAITTNNVEQNEIHDTQTNTTTSQPSSQIKTEHDSGLLNNATHCEKGGMIPDQTNKPATICKAQSPNHSKEEA